MIYQVKGTFRVRGDVIEIVPGHTESYIIRIELFGDEVDRITEVDHSDWSCSSIL